MDAVDKELDQFLKENGFVEGEYTKLEAFGDQHEVSADEAAIFDAAVDGYPMIHAKAQTVAARAIPGGTEYLFTAEDLQRKDKPQAAPDQPMQVYVTVADGEAPVFTQVVR